MKIPNYNQIVIDFRKHLIGRFNSTLFIKKYLYYWLQYYLHDTEHPDKINKIISELIKLNHIFYIYTDDDGIETYNI